MFREAISRLEKSEKEALKEELVLSTVFQPFGRDDEFGVRGTLTEFFYAHVSGHQKEFSIRGHNPIFGLRLIKENLDIKTTILVYPSLKDLEREIKKRRPMYFGVSVNVPTIGKGVEMCRIVKEIDSRIVTIMGGVGVAVYDEESKPNVVDQLCQGEGVAFLRKLIDKKNPQAPIKHPFVVNPGSYILGHSLPATGYVAPNLGCQEGCEFCTTSHFFKIGTVPLVKSGKDFASAVFDAKDKLNSNYKVKRNFSFSVLSEDFFRDRNFFFEFCEEIKKRSKTVEENFSFTCFGSIDSILKLEEGNKNPYEILAEVGVGSVWIGVESILRTREKTKGPEIISSVFSELKKHGIQTVASLVMGFDWHDQDTIYKDIEFLLDLAPSFCQFAVLTPYPPTPTYIKYKQRIIQPDWKYWNGFHLVFKHDHFTPEQLEEVRQEALKLEIERLGPSFLRLIDTLFTGYKYLCDSQNPYLKERALYYKYLLKDAVPLLLYMKPEWERNYQVNEKIKLLIQNIRTMREGKLKPLSSLWNICCDSCKVKILEGKNSRFLRDAEPPDNIIQPPFQVE